MKTRTGIGARVLSLLALTVFAAAVVAQEENCADCHEDVSFESSAHPDLFCADCHTNVPPEHDGEDLEPLTDAERVAPAVIAGRIARSAAACMPGKPPAPIVTAIRTGFTRSRTWLRPFLQSIRFRTAAPVTTSRIP